jgi:hypothetical protein
VENVFCEALDWVMRKGQFGNRKASPVRDSISFIRNVDKLGKVKRKK